MSLFLSWKPKGESTPTLQLLRRWRSTTVSLNSSNRWVQCFVNGSTKISQLFVNNYPFTWSILVSGWSIFFKQFLRAMPSNILWSNSALICSCEAISASDYVEFSNFMARDRKYSRHCGQLKEFDIESDRKFFRVTFRSNDRLDGTGFNATYHFMDEVETYTGRPSESSKGPQSIHGRYYTLTAKQYSSQ